MTTKANAHDTITDMFITAIEAGWVDGSKWVRPWSLDGTAPINAVTGKAYQGLNRLVMMMLGINYAAGVKQWNTVGARTRKGSKCIPITAPMFVKDEANPDGQRLVGFRLVKVMPSTMVDGWEAPQTEGPAGFDRDATVEAFIADTGAVINYGGGVACHYPATNEINCPHSGQFHSVEDYYGTILHELIHWSSVKGRCDRRTKVADKFTTLRDAYAFEELIAELGASFLCADLGVHPGFRQDHGEYIAYWLKQLRSDNRAIFDAARYAQQAVTYIHAEVDKARKGGQGIVAA